MSAAKWHREQARKIMESSVALASQALQARNVAKAHAAMAPSVPAAHHATAADALTALAVPGVAEALRDLSQMPAAWDFTDEIRVALATLAKTGADR